MAIPSLTLRTVKGSALTFSEADANFQNLANAQVAVSAGGTTSNIALNGPTGAPTAITFANSATVQATQTSGTITLTSNITPGATFANSATVGTSVAGGITTITLATTGTAGTYSGAVTTDVYGRVTAGSNNLAANVDAQGFDLQNVVFNTYRERVANVGPLTGTVTIDANVAPIQTAGTTGNITINSNNLTNFLAGESVTLILRHNGANRTFTSNVKFVNGGKTISGTTANTDVITFFFDGTEYLASVARYNT